MRNQKGIVYLLVLLLAFPTVSYGVRDKHHTSDTSLSDVEKRTERSPSCPADLKMTIGAMVGSSIAIGGIFSIFIYLASQHDGTVPVTCCDPCMDSFDALGVGGLFYCAHNGTEVNKTLRSVACPFYSRHFSSNLVLMCDDSRCIEPSFSVSMMKNGTLYCDDLSNDTDSLPPLVPVTIKSGE